VTAILNPSTGRRRSQEIESILRETLSGKVRLSIRRTERAQHAIALARAAARYSDFVIAVGGDGTVGEVATGLLGTGVPMAIIPTGSTNVIARGLNIPLDPKRAARMLQGPTETKLLDGMLASERVALHMIGCGFDAMIMEDAPQSLKRAAAWIAYVPAALKHVTGRSWKFRITIDGEEIATEARMVLVANGSFVLDPRFAVGRNIRADDGVLDVIVFTPPNLAAATTVASWLAVGQIDRSQYVQQFRGKQIRIESEPPAPVECDGDVVGATPVEITVLPRAVPVIVPLESTREERRPPSRDTRTLELDRERARLQEVIWSL
jgi:YegS/Rv2252/BmrU family lipid kinase